MSDAKPIQMMGDGPQLPGEDQHQAMGENSAQALAGHLLSRSTQGVSNGTFSTPGQDVDDAHPMASGGMRPGGSIEDEPVDDAERAAQHTAQTVAADTPNLSHTEPAANIRSVMRAGSVGA
jgi:hypothetical protein